MDRIYSNDTERLKNMDRIYSNDTTNSFFAHIWAKYRPPLNSKTIKYKKQVIIFSSLAIAILIILPLTKADTEILHPYFPSTINYTKGSTKSGNLNNLYSIDNNNLVMQDSSLITPPIRVETDPNNTFENNDPPFDNIWAGAGSEIGCDSADNTVYKCVDEGYDNFDLNYSYMFSPYNGTIYLGFPELQDTVPLGAIITTMKISLIMRKETNRIPEDVMQFEIKLIANYGILCLIQDWFLEDLLPDNGAYNIIQTIDIDDCDGYEWNTFLNTDLRLQLVTFGLAPSGWGHILAISTVAIRLYYTLDEQNLNATLTTTPFRQNEQIKQLRWNCNYTSSSPYYLGIKNTTNVIRWLNTTSLTNQTKYNFICPFKGSFYSNLTINDKYLNRIRIIVRDNQSDDFSYLYGTISFDYLVVITFETFFLSSESLQWIVYALIVGGTLFTVAFMFYIWKKRRDGD